MHATLTLSNDRSLIVQTVTGAVTAPTALQVLTDLIALAQTSGARSVLVDARGITASMSILDAHSFGTALGEHGLLGLRFAVVVRNNPAARDFFETAATTGGVTIRYFTEYEQALAWLDSLAVLAAELPQQDEKSGTPQLGEQAS